MLANDGTREMSSYVNVSAPGDLAQCGPLEDSKLVTACRVQERDNYPLAARSTREALFHTRIADAKPDGKTAIQQ